MNIKMSDYAVRNKLSTETVKDYEEMEFINKEGEQLSYPIEPIRFSTTKTVSYVSIEDLTQVREWKNRAAEIRDRYKDKNPEMFVLFDLEVKRLIEFLSNNSH